jgi:hypothetical protein
MSNSGPTQALHGNSTTNKYIIKLSFSGLRNQWEAEERWREEQGKGPDGDLNPSPVAEITVSSTTSVVITKQSLACSG